MYSTMIDNLNPFQEMRIDICQIKNKYELLFPFRMFSTFHPFLIQKRKYTESKTLRGPCYSGMMGSCNIVKSEVFHSPSISSNFLLWNAFLGFSSPLPFYKIVDKKNVGYKHIPIIFTKMYTFLKKEEQKTTEINYTRMLILIISITLFF